MANQVIIDGEVCFGSTNKASAIICKDINGNDSTLEQELNKINNLLNNIYPIGSVYISVNDISPTALFGGVWEKICQGRTLFGADSSHNPGDLIEAGLPNITGTLEANTNYSGSPYAGTSFSGAFYGITMSGTNYYLNGRSTGSGWLNTGFDASKSNSIYGKSNTVQPPALVVNI